MILARILLDRVRQKLLIDQRHEQSGFSLKKYTVADVFWGYLVLRGIPPKLVNLISGLYSGSESAVWCDGTISNYFPLDTVVRQKCVLSNILQHLYRLCTE